MSPGICCLVIHTHSNNAPVFRCWTTHGSLPGSVGPKFIQVLLFIYNNVLQYIHVQGVKHRDKHFWLRELHVRCGARALTHPAETRESDPSTTPPSNSMAMMVVCGHHEDSVCVSKNEGVHSTRDAEESSFLLHLPQFSPPSSATPAHLPSTC